MIAVRFIVCSDFDRKPLTRGVFDARDDALRLLRQLEVDEAEGEHWLAEMGPEADAWRHLGRVPQDEGTRGENQ